MNKWIVALSVVLPTLLEVIDTSVVNVSLGHIRGSLSAGVDESTWTITAYLVSNAIIIPLTGWLSRTFGRKRYLVFSVILFTFSSAACGFSKSLQMLIFFRILQGFGGGALQPLSQSILFETFPPREYGMATAMFGIGVMFGPIVGPVLGGWITDNWSWPWIFYINIPLGIFSLIMIMLFIHDPHYLRKAKQKIDYWGLSLIVLGIGSLQVVIDKGQREDWFSSNFINAFAVIAVICLVLFIIVELKVPNPVINLRVFKDISFSIGNVIMFVTFFVLFGGIVLLPLFVQELLGYNAYLAGLALAPGGIATLIIMPIVGKMVTKINPKWILAAGMVITAYSMHMMINFNLHVDFFSVAWPRVVMGIGLGMLFIPLMSMAFTTIHKEEMPNATSVFNLLRNLGGSIGVAFVTTVLSRRAQFHQFRFSEQLNPYDPGYQIALHNAMNALKMKLGAATDLSANGLIYRELMRHASLSSYNDAFYICAVLMICVLPLVYFLKKPVHPEAAMVH